MSNNLWEDDANANEEFRDIPDEAQLDSNKQPMQAPPVNVQVTSRNSSTPVPPQPYRPSNIPAEPIPTIMEDTRVEFGYQESTEDAEEDFSEVLNDANLRIEQGKLYQMVMNHDLFANMEADPRAVQNVQKEIRKFARERMEIMLGMRQEQAAKDYANYASQLSNPFNELEVEILKSIASKATNGATETEEANQLANSFREAPRKTLNPIGGSTALKKGNVQVSRSPTKLQSKASVPLQRKKNDATVEQILAEEGVPRELIEENYKPLTKPLHELSEEEQIKRARETAARLAKHKTVKSAQALPMATEEQQAMLAMQRASQVGQGPGMAALLEKVKSMPIKNP